jgi:hypothetical protein
MLNPLRLLKKKANLSLDCAPFIPWHSILVGYAGRSVAGRFLPLKQNPVKSIT